VIGIVGVGMGMNVAINSSITAILIIFGFIGGGLKFIDDAFEKDIFDMRVAMVLTPIILVLWVWISVVDTVSAVILFSILLGVLLTGKIDNFIFKISTITLIAFFDLRSLGHYLMPLVFLTLMSIADEIGNDFVDNNSVNKLVKFFFLHRFSMKFGIMLLCVTSYFPPIYLVAFLCFDIAYDSVGIVSKSIVAKNERMFLHSHCGSATV